MKKIDDYVKFVTKDVSPDEPVYTLPPYKVEKVYITVSETIDWGLEMLNVPKIWHQTTGDGIKIAVLDTGIAFEHPDLRDTIFDAKDFTGSRSGPADVQGHGTHVAGIIAARQDSNGVVGVAPQAKLLIGKVLGDNGFGTARAVAEGIEWAIESNADVISMSLGSPYPDSFIHEAIYSAIQKNIFVVCAAGNRGPRVGTVEFPGAFDEVVTVGAIDRRMLVPYFSSRGKQVDVVAPGDDILSTYPPHGYAVLSGTSMATPFVSGAVALILSKHKKFGGTTPINSQNDLLQHLIKTSIDAGPTGFDPSYGFGIINPTTLVGISMSKNLDLIADEDLTTSGQKKFQQFIGQEIRASVSGEAYLEGRLDSNGGQIVGGIRIRF